MKPLHSQPSTLHQSRAFSLVEVTLALGVAAFALVAIFGLLPVGLTSNQNSVEQTAAAGVASSLVADLRATPSASTSSPRFLIPIPATGTSTATLFLKEDGTISGAVNANASPALNPRYRATLYFFAPTTAGLRTATSVRVLLTWPAMADPTAATAPSKFSGSFETMTTLDRN